jgi:hypothetical protein
MNQEFVLYAACARRRSLRESEKAQLNAPKSHALSNAGAGTPPFFLRCPVRFGADGREASAKSIGSFPPF